MESRTRANEGETSSLETMLRQGVGRKKTRDDRAMEVRMVRVVTAMQQAAIVVS